LIFELLCINLLQNQLLYSLLTYNDDFFFIICQMFCALTFKKNITKSILIINIDSGYQFWYFNYYVQKFSKINNLAVWSHSQMIFSLYNVKLCVYFHKKNCINKSVIIINWDPAYQFFHKNYTYKVLSRQRKFITLLFIDIFQWFLHHSVWNYSYIQTKIKNCIKVFIFTDLNQATSGYFKNW